LTDRPTTPTPVTLHLFLGIGLMAVTVALFVLRYLGIPQVPRHEGITPMVAYGFSALALVLAAVALVVIKPRVPSRPPEQSVNEYWSSPEVLAKVMPIWFLLEGAATLAAIGYLFTGEPVTAITTGAAVVAYWLCGPNVFAKA
jgi:hypothetical protein